MRSAPLLVREDDPDLLGDVLVPFHEPQIVIVVGNAYRAFAGGHGANLVGVAALRRAREVGDHALRPFFGLLLSVMPDSGSLEHEILDISITRQSGVKGKSVSVRVNIGCRRIIRKKK